MDNLIVAADVLKNKISGEARGISPLDVREKLDELSQDKEIIAFCKISLRGYEAQKILESAGFRNVKFMDGGILAWPFEYDDQE